MSHSAPDVLQILSAVPYFAELDAAALQMVARAAVRRHYSRGQIIFVEGDASVGLYILEDGWLRVYKTSPDGREQVIHFLGPGETFNMLSVFTDAPNPATAAALELSAVWLVRRDVMLGLLDSHPQLARVVIRQLAGRVQHLVGLVEDLSLRTVEARLARTLLENAGEGTMFRHRWATQAEMAARMGTVPDVLSRALRKLAAEGLIQVSRHQIQIIDQAGLEQRANS